MSYLKFKNLFQKIIKNKKSAYVDAEIIRETYKTIIACPVCKQKLRVPVLQNKRLRVTCQKCGNGFSFDCEKHRFKQKFKVWGIVASCLLLLLVDAILPVYLVSKKDSSVAKVRNEYGEKIKKMQNDFTEERRNLKSKYDTEVAQINIAELNTKAKAHYEQIWQERKNLDTKYAITPREKAQLEMLALSKDKTKGIEDIIRSVALKAAPRDSAINVYASSAGYNLDIDFDMSELSSGEEGTRTKHSTVDSLKRDVIRLISKVTNDVYQFCQNLDLESIAIGCRHFVNQYMGEYKVSLGKQNIVLYKVRLNRKDLSELKNNPFLDIYSTTRYFKIEEDDFSNLQITESRSYEK